MKFVRFLLFPFAIVYYLATSIRNFLYDVGFLTSTSFKIPVIVVGNLSVGGTGKTPQIEYLINLLKENYKTAVLSRGYKRKTKGFLLIDKNNSVDEVGDEPMQYFKKFNNISVAVDENRVEGVQLLLTKKSPEVVLLDDAYQHRKIKGSYYILLTKFDELFTNDFILPVGNLRESSLGAKRADCIVVTKCPDNLNEEVKNKIIGKLNIFTSNIYFSKIAYSDKILGDTVLPIEKLNEYSVLLITGIANPTPLLNFLNDKEVRFNHLKFGDHHHFSATDIQKIKSEFDAISMIKKKLILTTEKDYVRLSGKLPICYLPIETKFFEEKNEFNNAILEHVSERIKNTK